MNFVESLFVRIIIFFRLDKIIDACKSYVESREEREDLEKERSYRSLANFSRNVGHEYFADYFEKEADIIKDTKKTKWIKK